MKFYKIIEELKLSPVFNYLLEHDPELIFITGSLSQEILDEYSDLDLVIITKNSEQNPYSLKYKDTISIHWFSRPQEFLQGKFLAKKTLDLVGGAQLWNLSEKHIVYSKEHINIKEVIRQARASSMLYIERFISEMSEFLKEVLLEGLEKESSKTKFLYHLCWISHVIEETPINKEMCSEIKRIRYTPISSQAQDYCFSRLTFLENYLKKQNK